MNRWSIVPLGDLGADVRHACVGGPFGSELTTKDYMETGVPVIRGSNLGEDEFVDSGFVYVSEEKARALQQNQAKRGDIIFTQRGTVGQVAIIPQSARFDNYVLSQSQMKLTPDLQRVDSGFLRHYFRSSFALNFLKRNILATGVPHINLSILRRVPVPLPPLSEQRHITDILDKADAIRRKRKEAIALTEELLRSAFLELFGDSVVNPKNFDVAPLGSLADIAAGVAKGKRYEGQTTVIIPYMRVANVQDGHLFLGDVKSLEVSKDEAVRYRLQVGDVLLTEGGDPDKLGRGAVWSGEIDPCIHQNHIFRVRTKEQLVPQFLSAQLGSARGKRYFLRAAKQTTGIASINLGQLKDFPVFIPPLPLQAAYVRVREQISALKERLRIAAATTEELFGALLSRAFATRSMHDTLVVPRLL